MPENFVVRKYGTRRKSVPIPKSVESEIKVGDPVECIVDRANKAIVYFFKNSDILSPEDLEEKVKEISED